VGVLRIDHANAEPAAAGPPLAVVVNYTCHPTCLGSDNRLLSADYPGLVTSAVEAASGAVCLFLTGACGDIGPVERGEASLKIIGQAVAAEVLRVLPSLAPVAPPVLDTEGEILDLPLGALPSREELVTLREQYQAASLEADAAGRPLQARIARALEGWTERILALYKERRLPATVQAELQTIHLGDLVLAGVPGELFVELGLQIKAGTAPRQLFVCGFANGNVGYIPARRAYPHGGYEIDEAYKYYGYPGALAPEAGEQIVSNVLRLIKTKG
jgi:hypothetical protein